MLIRALLFTAIIVASFAFNRLLFGLLHGFERSGLDYFGWPLLRDTIIAFVIFLAISEFLQMRRVIGGRTLNALLLGRYHRPVREERIFLLVDIKGSTALAERLGDERAHAFITSTFFDIDQPILEHGGEVYSYVGDGLIASWPLAGGVEAPAACVATWRSGTRLPGALATIGSTRNRARGPRRAARRADRRRRVRRRQALDRLSRRHPEHRRQARAGGEDAGPGLPGQRRPVATHELPAALTAEPLGPIALRGRQQPVDTYALEPAGDLAHGPREGAALDRPRRTVSA